MIDGGAGTTLASLQDAEINTTGVRRCRRFGHQPPAIGYKPYGFGGAISPSPRLPSSQKATVDRSVDWMVNRMDLEGGNREFADGGRLN